MSSGFLDILPGESIAIAADEAPSVDLMYRPGEPIFGAVARDLVANGWSVFPQDDERRPGVVNNQAIAWVKEHKLPTQLPRPEALDLWIRALPTHNVAVALGPGSGHAFAIDIDITDHDLSNRVAALAEEMLGATPLVRIGKAPKIALIYRYDPADPLQNISRKLSETDENGKIVASEHAIEILTQGKPITLLGKHHTTGRYFRWLYQSPMEIGPEAAPLVSSERMAAFLEAIDENIRRFHRSSNMFVQPEEVTWDEKAKTYIPRLTTVAGGSAWSENEDGLIEDGREAYLTSLVHSFVRTNPGMPGDQIKANVFDLFSNSVVMEGRWSPTSAQREVNSKVDSLLSKISGGEYHMRYRTVEPSEEKVVFTDGKFKLPYSRIDLEKRGLGFLPDYFKRCTIPGRIVDQGEPYVLTDEQRQKDIDNIGTGLTNALDEFFEDMFAVNCGRNPQESVVHVIKAPTGAGKTSRTIAYIGAKKDEHRARANRPRMEGRRDEDGRVVVPAQGLDLFYEDENGNEHPGSMPIVFLLPTYANIEEVRIRAETLNLDPTLSDEELKDSARERGLVPEEELESRLDDMRRDAMNAGLTTLVYKGKIAAGCQMADKVKAAMEAGIGSSAFCKADVKRDNGESETVFCPHYIGCPAISQKELIQQADLVFTPHPFMQLNIPRELSAARAVIADERIHHLFLHTAEFPAEHLTLPRKPVRLKAEERDRGDMEEDFVLARNAAVDIAYDAMLADKCPAKALYEHEEVMPDGTVMRNGPDLVEKCLRICSNALRKDVALNPELDLEQVIELCSQPTGIHVREEHRFWKIIHERIQMLTRQNLEIAGGRQAEINAIEDPDERQAHQDLYDMELERLREFPLPKGEKDLRIQLVKDDLPSGHVRRSIRISWRTVPNWADVPLLLLDASAAPEIIHKIWGGTRVRSHDISGPLHMRVVGVVNRTFSNASVVGDPKATDSHKLVTARNLAQLRNAISAVSSWFGHSRVVCGSSILVRRIINTDWKGPENVDWCHFGAMRGLDFAKYHAAALSIGRMELPVRTIDGLVAALTYDDDEPELPFDVDGTGKKKVGNAYLPLLMPSEPQKLRMRSGELVEIPTPMHPGKWGRLIQRQYREEELLQFCGRLRPVYREGEAPIWFALSSVIPENLIIDDLVHIDDLVRMRERAWFWDAARRTHGILHPDVLAETCPEFFADRSEAKTVMNLQGFSYETGETTKSTSQGYTPYRIVSDRADAYAFVLTELDDRRERLEAALRKHGITFSAIELAIDGAEPRSIARARVADTIDVELGQLEDREADELVNAERANVRLFSMGVKRMDELMPNLPSHPLTYAISSAASNENQRIRFYDAEAQETLDSIWEKMLYDQAVRQNAVMQDNGETYDRLGDHIGDNDSGN